MEEQALSHVRVVDLTHFFAGPYCTKLMAGFGADVVKVERPGQGDKLRKVGPFYQGKEGLERSIPFLWLNTGKRSITLNLKEPKGVEIFRQLIEGADALIENFSPGVMDGLGLDNDTLREMNPGLIVASISNFGQTGPYRDWKAEEMELYAMSGLMHMTGDSEREPLASGPALCQYSAGLHAYSAILMTLFQRGMTGRGQCIDISIMECGLEHIETSLTNYLHQGNRAVRGKHLYAPWGLYPCKDGYATVISAPFRHWQEGAGIFEEPRLLEERYGHPAGRAEHREEVDELIQPWLSGHEKEEIFHAGQGRGLAFGFLADLEQAATGLQHQSRSFFSEMDHPVVGRHPYCDAPFKMSGTPWINRRAPLLGEHNQVVYGEELGFAPEDIRLLEQEEVI